VIPLSFSLLSLIRKKKKRNEKKKNQKEKIIKKEKRINSLFSLSLLLSFSRRTFYFLTV
jgi:hypothetical protein